MKQIEYIFDNYTDDDYEFVYETKKQAYKKYVEANWGEWNEDKQREMFADFIKTYGDKIQMIMLGYNKIGFYHGEDIGDNKYELGNICIIPEYQGKGLGTKILKEIISEQSGKDIYLRYFKQNPVVRLYKRLGFEIIEELPYHYKMVLRQKVI